MRPRLGQLVTVPSATKAIASIVALHIYLSSTSSAAGDTAADANPGLHEITITQRSPLSSRAIMAQRCHWELTDAQADYDLAAERFVLFVPEQASDVAIEANAPMGLLVWISPSPDATSTNPSRRQAKRASAGRQAGCRGPRLVRGTQAT